MYNAKFVKLLCKKINMSICHCNTLNNEYVAQFLNKRSEQIVFK